MKMRPLQYPVFNPYIKPTCEIYISGCTRHCKECHNPELQDFNFGNNININELLQQLKEGDKFYKIISITGGDLLCQQEKEAEAFILILKENLNDKKFWLFTGAEKDECPEWVWKNFDVIKTGKYLPEKCRNGFPASSNQIILIKGEDY